MEEREEGELSEGELSDISSEEEYLLRQRLQVLESYNNVLERKDRRRRSVVSNGDKGAYQSMLPDLSEISGSDLENSIILNIARNNLNKNITRKSKLLKPTKKKNHTRKSNTTGTSNKKNHNLTKHRTAIKKETVKHSKETVKHSKETVKHSKERSQKVKRKKTNEVKVVHDSSDDTDYEYRNKRRRLQHSVQISNPKSDCTTLRMRLMNMFTDKTNSITDGSIETLYHDKEQILFDKCDQFDTANSGLQSEGKIESDMGHTTMSTNESLEKNNSNHESNFNHDSGSDDDIELLRQIALQTKLPKPPIIESEPVDHISDSDDSHELRVICLKSSLLKRAIAIKQKNKLRNRIRTMSSIDDILTSKLEEDLSYTDGIDEHNNTDIESIDMEIGVSDSPDTDVVLNKDDKFTDTTATFKEKAQSPPQNKNLSKDDKIIINKPIDGRTSAQSNEKLNMDREEDLEEDEDLLRTKLLTSLSRNLTDKTGHQKNNVVSANKSKPTTNKDLNLQPKKFIINIGESDGSDDEATKNLTKMHMKLCENIDFQQKLDLLLKSARMETEHKLLPNSTEHTPKQPTSAEKFVPKAVNHLPKSGQIEYRRLVKRMAELERLKQTRQASLNHSSNNTIDRKMKITLKNAGGRTVEKAPKIVQVEDRKPPSPPDLESQIALSRKRIAAESAKVLRLKEESNQLLQQYNDAVALIRRVRSAMFTNRREEQAVQVSLVNMRTQHQLLLKRSKMPTNKHVLLGNSTKNVYNTKTFHDHKKSKEDLPNITAMQTVKMAVNNSEKNYIPEHSVHLDLGNNKKTVIPPKQVCPPKEFYPDTKNCKKDSSNSTAMKTTEKQLLGSKNTINCGLVEKIEQPQHESKACILKIADERVISSLKIDATLIKTEASEMVPIAPALRSDLVITPKVENCIKSDAKDLDDYKSPLSSMRCCMSLEGDPHGILCPFEVWGTCKDAGCKYMHPKVAH